MRNHRTREIERGNGIVGAPGSQRRTRLCWIEEWKPWEDEPIQNRHEEESTEGAIGGGRVTIYSRTCDLLGDDAAGGQEEGGGPAPGGRRRKLQERGDELLVAGGRRRARARRRSVPRGAWFLSRRTDSWIVSKIGRAHV